VGYPLGAWSDGARAEVGKALARYRSLRRFARLLANGKYDEGLSGRVAALIVDPQCIEERSRLRLPAKRDYLMGGSVAEGGLGGLPARRVVGWCKG
jgi:hypothetical protein